MYVEFADPELERIRQIRRAEFDAEAADRRAAQSETDREREVQDRERLRDLLRAPDPEPGGTDDGPSDPNRKGEDPDAPDGPDASERGPEIDR